jgi:hypothetical protein
MGEWDKDNKAIHALFGPEAEPPKPARPWHQTFRRLTEAEKAERSVAEWKAAKARSIV